MTEYLFLMFLNFINIARNFSSNFKYYIIRIIKNFEIHYINTFFYNKIINKILSILYSSFKFNIIYIKTLKQILFNNIFSYPRL